MGQKNQNCYYYKYIWIFDFILAENNSSECLPEGLKWRCYTVRWLWDWTTSYSVDFETQSSQKLLVWILHQGLHRQLPSVKKSFHFRIVCYLVIILESFVICWLNQFCVVLKVNIASRTTPLLVYQCLNILQKNCRNRRRLCLCGFLCFEAKITFPTRKWYAHFIRKNFVAQHWKIWEEGFFGTIYAAWESD